jgi:hypothetical protein
MLAAAKARRGLPVVLRGKHVAQRDVGIPLHAEHAVHAVGNVLAVFVGAMQRVEDRSHHGQRAEPRVVENFVMKFFGRRAVPSSLLNVHGDGHRNHLRLLPRHAHDPVLAILHESADRLGRVDDLERIQRRRQRGQHRGLRHRQIHFAKLQQRMSAGQQALRIDVGHGAGGGNIHIAANQHGADGRARLDRLRLLAIARRANAHHRNDARRRELRSSAARYRRKNR